MSTYYVSSTKLLRIFSILFLSAYLLASPSAFAMSKSFENQDGFLINADSKKQAGDFENIPVISSEPSEQNFSQLEESRIEIFSLISPQLEGEEKKVLGVLPSDYNASYSSYPVLYLQDPGPGFIRQVGPDGIWEINTSRLDFYTKDILGEAIIVLVEAESFYNWDEYGPWVKEDMYTWMDPHDANQVEGGKGDLFLDFLIQTLKPEIDSKYRTLTDRGNTTIGGYKMGGLISLYAILTHPEIFSMGMLMSPAIWFGEQGGPWLSNNHLLNLIHADNLPADITMRFDVAPEDRASEPAFSPEIYDRNGKRLDYAQAYLEGVQSVVTALINEGFPVEKIKGSIENPEEWTENFIIRQEISRAGGFFTYLPIISQLPPVPPQITSADSTTFYTNTNQNSFTIRATGSPLPNIIISSGELPSGVEFIDYGNGTAALVGKPTLPDASIFELTFLAYNGVTPAATQKFTLRIADPAVLKYPDANSCIVKFNMHMTALDRDREIWVYLPPNYNTETSKHYQVIYLTDAQDLFGPVSASYNDWEFDEKLDFLYNLNNGKGTIAVAVAYDDNHKWDEYSPWDNHYMYNWVGYSPQNFEGRGDDMLNFIATELRPTINSRYRTLTDSAHTMIGGGSRNGLLAIYGGMVQPDIFSKVMAISPAIWVANDSTRWLVNNGFIHWIDTHTIPDSVNYYLYVGGKEWSGEGDYPPFGNPYPNNIYPKLTWSYIYKDGVDITGIHLKNDGVTWRKDYKYNGLHLPAEWNHYVDDALVYLGFYATNH